MFEKLPLAVLTIASLSEQSGQKSKHEVVVLVHGHFL